MNRFSRVAVAVASALTFAAVPALSATSVFNAHLSGNEEVPTRATKAVGVVQLKLSDDQTTLSYRINVSNIQNVVAAKLALAPVGETGPDVAMLYGPVAAGGGKANGVLTSGTLTADKLVGPLAGKTIADFVTEIMAGHIYVNVVTDDGVGPADEKSGDFASGEIRGQVK
jgi:hypothetical protein